MSARVTKSVLMAALVVGLGWLLVSIIGHRREVQRGHERLQAEMAVPVAIPQPAPPAFTGQPRREVPPHRPVTELPEIPQQPNDFELAASRVLPRRLIAVGEGGGAADNAALGVLLRGMRGADRDTALAAVDKFLQTHGSSRWAAVLRLELANHRFERGYFARAKDEWRGLWDELKSSRDLAVMPLADEVLARLLDTMIGAQETEGLKRLLADAEGRSCHASLEGRLMRARQALWLTEHTVAQNVRCGLLAVQAIKEFKGEPYTRRIVGKLRAEFLTSGLPLTEVARQANETYQFPSRPTVRTAAESAFPMPSVMHVKGDHYVALLAEREGRYRLEDRSTGFEGWVDRAALEDLSTGYFLATTNPLPAGFREASPEEARNVFGRDGAHGTSPTDEWWPAPNDDRRPRGSGIGGGPGAGSPRPKTWCERTRGMAGYDLNVGLAAVRLQDIPLGYQPPVGPEVDCHVFFNQLDRSQPITLPAYSHFGGMWASGWVAYLERLPESGDGTLALRVHGREGGTELLRFSEEKQLYGPHDRSFATVRRRTPENGYVREFPDGSKEIYDIVETPAVPVRFFLSKVIDPAGNSISMTYDSSLRMVAVTDAIGQVTTLQYAHPTDPWKVTSVTDPFSRVASFTYDAAGRLTGITDVIGLVSNFTYDASNRVETLTTPYGTTRFAYSPADGDYAQRWVQVTDPQGGVERVEFGDPGPVIESLRAPPGYVTVGGETVPFAAENERLQFRNSYYWDKLASARAPGDYTAARNYRWFTDRNFVVLPIMEAMKAPLEDRVWFNYPSNSVSEAFGLPYYAGLGGRPEKTLRMLADGTPQLVQSNYNFLGKPVKLVDPVGRITEFRYAINGVDLLEVRQTTGGINERQALFTYNAQHLPLTFTNAAGQLTQFAYNARGQLLSVTDPLGQITVFTYDGNARLIAVDGPRAGSGDSLGIDHDGLGRVSRVTAPDGYWRSFQYDDMDRMIRVTFPDATYLEATYDRLDLSTHRDRTGRTKSIVYDSLRQPVRVTDATGGNTALEWCKCGSLRSLTDLLGRVTRWNHDLQGRLVSKRFPDGSMQRFEYDTASSRVKKRIDAAGQEAAFEWGLDNLLRSVAYAGAAVATPTVSFDWDPLYKRLIRMQDGIGATAFRYQAAGTLGAGAIAEIDGPFDNDSITYQYDALGRRLGRTVNGVAASQTFDALGRILSVTTPLGTTTVTHDGATRRILALDLPGGQRTEFSYLPDIGDRRLQRIRNLGPGGVPRSIFDYTYDAAGRIRTWSQQQDADSADVWTMGYDDLDQLTAVTVARNGTTVGSHSYGYDAAGNRLTASANGVPAEFRYNVLNQLTDASPELPPQTCEWDAENRLVAIVRGTRRSEFRYDGFGRCCRIRELDGGSVVSDSAYLWDGVTRAEERSADGGSPVKRFFGAGFQVVGGPQAGNYSYTRDHLGSVREVLGTGGGLVQRTGYSPWGEASRTQTAPFADDIGFTGHFAHRPTGDWLAPYRAYSPATGRWNSRDPLGERGGLNLYGYSANDPVGRRDPLGLWSTDVGFGGGEVLQFGFGLRIGERVPGSGIVEVHPYISGGVGGSLLPARYELPDGGFGASGSLDKLESGWQDPSLQLGLWDWNPCDGFSDLPTIGVPGVGVSRQYVFDSNLTFNNGGISLTVSDPMTAFMERFFPSSAHNGYPDDITVPLWP